MSALLPLPLLKYVGMACLLLGFGWVVFASVMGDTLPRRYYRRYTGYLDRKLRLMFMRGSAKRIFLVQLLLVATQLQGLLLEPSPFFVAGVLVVCLAPVWYLERKHRQYIKRLEGQADAFILALANALKTVPSPTAALESIVPVLPQPMQQEIDRMLKDIRVGSTLEQALVNMSSRLKSADIDAALSSLMIGLQVGGNLPQVLETTASTIREMARLHGVIRTKTADARVQLWVLALFPFCICYAFVLIDPNFFWPLEQTFVGNLVTAVAVVLWLVSLVTARKVLKVDI